jgi:hypothetical protein
MDPNRPFDAFEDSLCLLILSVIFCLFNYPLGLFLGSIAVLSNIEKGILPWNSDSSASIGLEIQQSGTPLLHIPSSSSPSLWGLGMATFLLILKIELF